MRLKDLELAWRRLWIRALTRLLARVPDPAPPDWTTARVLFLRHDRIGDMIVSTGLLAAIAEANPGIAIDVLASPANAPVLDRNPAVAGTVVFRRRGIGAYPRIVRTLRAAHYDAVIDCMVTAPSLTTLLLMWASGARHRIGVAARGNDEAYTLLVPPLAAGTHMVERLGSLGAALGVDVRTADLAPRLWLGDEELLTAEAEWAGPAGGVEPGTRLLINVSAGLGHRFWPESRFVEAVRGAAGDLAALNVVVIAAPHEPERARAVAAALGGRAVATPTVRSAFALVATADVVLTPDTSIAHAVSALRRPGVAMYVQGTAQEWGLYGGAGVDVVSPTRELGTLQVEPVAAALRNVLRSVATPAPTLPTPLP